MPRIKKKTPKIGSVVSNSQKNHKLRKIHKFLGYCERGYGIFLKKFANQNEMYFDKNLNEFKLWNSRIPRNSSLEILDFLKLKYPRTPGRRM